MAITRTQLLAAVEKYLPRTANYVQSSDLGERDEGEIFERTRQVILTSLLVDPEAVFYIIFLATQRLLTSVDSSLSALDTTISILKSIVSEDPTRIANYDDLEAAQTSLVRLSSDVVSIGVFSSSALEEFQGNVEGFLASELAPNVASGNKAQQARDLRTSMESLKTGWAAVLERRASVFGIFDAYTALDLRAKVAASIVSAVQDKISDLLDELPAMTTSEQAEQADTIAIDLAAAEAALSVIGSAVSPIGTVSVGPFNDGFTGSDYLALESTARVEPVDVIRSGTDGKLKLTGPSGGNPFTGTSAFTVAPISGTLTDTISDVSVPSFITAGIEVGFFVTFVDVGSTHVITGVTADELTISPKLRHQASLLFRYAITDTPPGSRFQTLTADFWTDYASGSAASTIVASGTHGKFPLVIKASGSDGTVVQASGSAGVFHPRKSSGSTSDSGGGLGASVFEDLNATLLTDGVSAGDVLVIQGGTNAGTYTIDSVDSETQLTVTTVLPGSDSGANTAWYVEGAAAEDWFFDASASFLTDGVEAGEIIRIASTDYTITSVIDQTTLELSGGPFTYLTGKSWAVRAAANNVLYSDVDFFGFGVAAGDLIDIDGEGEKTITDVAVGFVELATGLSSISLAGAGFEVYKAPGTYTDRFKQTDSVDFETLKVGATIEVVETVAGQSVESLKPTILTVAGIVYGVQGRDPTLPASTLVVLPLLEGVGTFPTSESFTAGVDFVAAGVDPAKHLLVIVGGPNSGSTFEIFSVSETTLDVELAAVSSDDSTFQIWPKIHTGSVTWSVKSGEESKLFTSSTPAFSSTDEGAILVYNPGASERRVTIDTYVSATQVWTSDTLPSAPAPFAVIREVLPGSSLAAAGRSYKVTDIIDATTVEVDPTLSNSVGVDVSYQFLRGDAQERTVSRLHDPVGAAAWDPVNGFTDELVGKRVDIMLDRPIRSVVARVFDADADGFAEAVQVQTKMALGRRSVAYRILSGSENTTSVFHGSAGAALEDFLTVWTLPDVYAVTDVLSDDLTVSPTLPSKQRGLSYVVTRGGAKNYGRYLLFSGKNDQIDLSSDTSLLRLRVAEVLTDFGAEATSIDTGTGTGIIDGDTNGDGLGEVFRDSTASLSTANVGDKLIVTYPGPTVEVTFISSVSSATRARIDPPLATGTALNWVLERNSVSAALGDALSLQRQLQELRQLLTEYVISVNTSVETIIQLLQEQRLDRMIDLLYDGDISGFINATRELSSYASAAKSGIQSVGLGTSVTSAVAANVSGVAPAPAAETAAGQSTAAGTSAALTADEVLSLPTATSKTALSGTSASGGSTVLPSEVETRVALAKSANDLADDSLLRSLAFSTLEEQRNRAIYELSGRIVSGLISDTDPTLPWISKTGSIRDRLEARYEKAKAALQYMLDNPDMFDDVGS